MNSKKSIPSSENAPEEAGRRSVTSFFATRVIGTEMSTLISRCCTTAGRTKPKLDKPVSDRYTTIVEEDAS